MTSPAVSITNPFTRPSTRSFTWSSQYLRRTVSTLLVTLGLAALLMTSLTPALAQNEEGIIVHDSLVSSRQTVSTSQADNPAQPADESDIIAASYFDTEREGWRVDGDVQAGSGIPLYLPLAGHPGGHLRAIDDVEGGTWYWVAPDKFLGDVSAAYSKTLSFDLRQDSEMSSQFDGPDVVIRGTTNALIYNTAFNPRHVWTEYSLPLSEGAGWMKIGVTEPVSSAVGVRASEADIKAVLQNVRGLLIRGEFENGADEGFLDNVVLGGGPKQPRIDVLNGVKAQLEIGDLSLLVEFPAGAVSETLSLQSGLSQERTAPEKMRQIGNSFFIEAHTGGGESIHSFQQPFTITLFTGRVDHEDFHIFSPQLHYWDENENAWKSIPSTWEPATGMLVANLDHLTEFALFGATKGQTFLPMTSR